MATPAPRQTLPRFLQKGRGETLSMPLYDESAVVSPTGGTFTLLDSTGAEVVTGAVVVTDGVATYALTSTFADNHSLPQSPWRERWELTGVPGAPGSELTVENEVHVCRVAPVRHVTLEHLYRMHSVWRRQIPRAYPSGNANDPLDDAWEDLLARLLGDGHLPHRLLNWWRLSKVHKLLAAARVCRNFQTDAPGDSRWGELGTEYEAAAWSDYDQHVGLQSDSNEDGVADTPGKLDSAEPPLYLTSIPGMFYGT